jgi:coenzyme F420-dependent glucose-6-phosphate dehydrogenase
LCANEEPVAPKVGQLSVCWAESEKAARETALEVWPNAGLKGPLGQELALPGDFEDVAEMVDEEAIAGAIVCGPDPERHLRAIDAFSSAGFDRVYVHQVGANQEGFFRFYKESVLPEMIDSKTHAHGEQMPV